MQFQPESIRSLFFCLEEPNQIANCCQYLNCSISGKESKNGPKTKSSSKSIVNISKKTVHKKFKSKKKNSINKNKKKKTAIDTAKKIKESSKSSTQKSRNSGQSSSKSSRTSVKSQYDKVTENLSNSLRSFQFQTEQLLFKHSPESFDREDLSIVKNFENILQDLYFDVNKLNLYIGKNSQISAPVKSKSAQKREENENLKPSGSKTSGKKSLVSLSGKDKLLSDSYLLIKILHFECNLLKCLQVFETLFNVDVAILISSDDRFSVVNRYLINLCRVYYSLLTKLNVPKATFVIHTSSKRNASAIFCILSRILTNRKALSIQSPIRRDKDRDKENDGEEILEVETSGPNSVPELRLRDKRSDKKSSADKKSDKTGPVSSSDPGKCLSFLMLHIEQLIKRDLYATNFDQEPGKGQPKTLATVKMGLIGLNRLNTMEFALNSSLVGVLRDLFGPFVKKFKNLNVFRQRVIEILAFVCIKRNGTLDAIAIGSGFIQDLLSLLSLMGVSHAKLVFRDLTKVVLTHEPNTPLRAVKKNYLSILKDIYGLLSIFLSFTEFKEGIECLQFHNVAENLYGSFLEPFVEMLNGQEDCDPKHLKHYGERLNFKSEPKLAFESLKMSIKENSKMNRLMDRIVGISSMIIQRLLPTVVIPPEALDNPFTFPLPEVDGSCLTICDKNPGNNDKNLEDSKDIKPNDDYMVMDEYIEYDSNVESECEYESEDSEAVKNDKDSVNESILPSYLQFFPEVDFNHRGRNADCLNCDCGTESGTLRIDRKKKEMKGPKFGERKENSFGMSLRSRNLENIPVENKNILSENHNANTNTNDRRKNEKNECLLASSEWKNHYEYFYSQTKTVMPKVTIPFPDANFVYDSVDRNQPLQAMSYPFLDQIPQRKNYHYVKTIEMIQSRFGERQRLIKIYDNSVQNPGILGHKIEVSKIQSQNSEIAIQGPSSDPMTQGQCPEVPMQDSQILDSTADSSNKYLKFDSMFECGNLRSAMVVENPSRIDEEEYILTLCSDVNTTIHTQWFYFSVSGTRTDKRYRFKVINLQKKSILYNSGQQPAFYSVADFRNQNKMWQRLGDECSVAYYRNHYVKDERSKMQDKFFTLEFCFNFKHDDDVCYFAYNVPYGYSFLRTNILQWKMIVDKQNAELNSGRIADDPEVSSAQNTENSTEEFGDENEESAKTFFFVQTLCSTLSGNDLPVLTITSRKNVQSRRRMPHYVFVTARVHPSESNSSWVMKGFVDSLLIKQQNPVKEQARRQLLDRFVFKIVPMLNPDGVINGSTRTGLQKVDLNRQWASPNPMLHPTIYHTKMLMKCLNHHSQGLNPVAYIDLHGHSRQKNIFSYSCSPFSSWKLADRMAAKRRNNAGHLCACVPSSLETPNSCQMREWLSAIDRDSSFSQQSYYFIPPYIMLPFLMYEQKAPCFSVNDCSFNIQKDRESSGRIVAWREFGVPLSYTIECSASGLDVGQFSGYHLDIGHLEEMGTNLAMAFDSLWLLKCGNRHVPVVVLEKANRNENENFAFEFGERSDRIESTMTREQLINKLYKKAAAKHAKSDPISIKLIDLYSDLNNDVYPLCSASTSVVSSVNATPSGSKTSTPARRKSTKKSRDSVNK